MTQIKLRRDTAANFTSKNPTLGIGEPAYETDTKKLKIGDGTTAYTDLAYFAGGGGGGTDISASLPLVIEDGVIKLQIDGQTLQVNTEGQLSANLDELGNEVNDLSGRVTAVEADILSKQDKFTAASPLDMKNVASVSLRDVTISGDNLSFGNNNLLTNQVTTSISTSSTFAQAIQSGIIIPYKFGQVLQFHCGDDTYVQGSNRRHGSPCVALFGHFDGSGNFVTALAINGFASYVSSAIRGNMGGALKAGATSMLPNTTHQTTSGQSSVERGENTINMGTDYSTYIQLMVNDDGNLMQGIYGHYGTNSTDVGWGAMARTDVIQDSSLNSGQTVADIIAAIDTAVIIKGSDFGTIKKANFGLYDYSERLPWTQAGYDTFIANKGDNLIDLDNPSTQPQLQLNIGDGLSVTAGKLTVTTQTPDVATTSTAGIVKPDGTSITVSDDGTISAVSSGGDVTATGDNTFSGENTFDKIILPNDSFTKGIFIDGQANPSILAYGDGLSIRDVSIFRCDSLYTGRNNQAGTIEMGNYPTSGNSDITFTGYSDTSTAKYTGLRYSATLKRFELGDTRIPIIVKGSNITNSSLKKFLMQGNVTASDGITVTETTDGIQISATGSSPEVYVNGNSGYIKYPNGYYEEWGFVPSGSGAATAITFMNTLADTNYNVVGGIQGAAGSTSSLNVSSGLIVVSESKKTTGFSTYQSTVAGKYWKISGKLAS